jgi:pyruvate-ferredoxin/flavodoxin oxidoreductase
MDAVGLSRRFGLAGRINMICQVVFFRLSNVIPLDDAVALLKATIIKAYSYKGEDVVKKNIDLLDAVVSDPNTLIKVEVPDRWKKLQQTDYTPYEDRHNMLLDDEKVRKFMAEIVDPVSRLEGDDIPVSKFLENRLLGGVMIPGTTKFEKRNPNPSGKIPKWNFDPVQCLRLYLSSCGDSSLRCNEGRSPERPIREGVRYHQGQWRRIWREEICNSRVTFGLYWMQCLC